MPEYFPAPQLPQGLAEQVLNLASQRGQYNPWIALVNAAAQTAQGWTRGVQQRREMMAKYPTYTVPQAQAAGFREATPQLFPKGVSQPFLELYQRAHQTVPVSPIEAQEFQLPEGTTEIPLAKYKELAKRGYEPVNEIDKENYQKAYGHPMPAAITSLRADQRKQIADLAKQQAKPKPITAMDMKGTPQWEKAIEKVADPKSGWLPEDIFRGMNQQARTAFMLELNEKHPEYNPQAKLAKRNQALATAGYMGRQGTRLSSAARAVDRNLILIEGAIKALGDVVIQPVTKALRQLDKTVTDAPQATYLLTMLRQTAFEAAVVESGGFAPNEIAQNKMLEIFADGLGKSGFEGVAQAVRESNFNRIQSLNNPWDVPSPHSRAIAPTWEEWDSGQFQRETKPTTTIPGLEAIDAEIQRRKGKQ